VDQMTGAEGGGKLASPLPCGVEVATGEVGCRCWPQERSFPRNRLL